MKFAQSLSYLMDISQISAYKLSQETRIPQAMIGRWKNGQQNPSTENLQKIADYFGVTLDYLLGKDSHRYTTTKELLTLRKILGSEYRLKVTDVVTCVCKELKSGYVIAIYCRSLEENGNCDCEIEIRGGRPGQPIVAESIPQVETIENLQQILTRIENNYLDPSACKKNENDSDAYPTDDSATTEKEYKIIQLLRAKNEGRKLQLSLLEEEHKIYSAAYEKIARLTNYNGKINPNNSHTVDLLIDHANKFASESLSGEEIHDEIKKALTGSTKTSFEFQKARNQIEIKIQEINKQLVNLEDESTGKLTD